MAAKAKPTKLRGKACKYVVNLTLDGAPARLIMRVFIGGRRPNRRVLLVRTLRLVDHVNQRHIPCPKVTWENDVEMMAGHTENGR